MTSSLSRQGLTRRAMLVALAMVVCAPASAATQRAFVSVGGVDNADCTVSAPCREFNAALAAAGDGGEVVVVDSGGYAPMTIGQSVSVLVPAGLYAGISVSTGDGVTIDAADGKVSITGVTITNQGGTGNGIVLKAAASLILDRVTIAGFSGAGAQALRVDVATFTHVDVLHGVLRSNETGVGLRGPGGSGVEVTIGDTLITGGVDGITVGDDVNLSLQNSTLSNLSGTALSVGANAGGRSARAAVGVSRFSHVRGTAIRAGGGDGQSVLTVSGAQIEFCGTAVDAGPHSTIRLVDSTLSDNATGLAQTGGQVESSGTNAIHGNGSDGPDPVVFTPK